MHHAPFRLFAIGALIWSAAAAKPLTITLPAVPACTSEPIRMGSARRPDGTTLTADARNLRLDGRPWTPVMGEFHYARYPAEEWREELLKLKAGGIDIVATYVFWIHHEEVQGRWDWTGRRNLRQFVETARDAGLTVIVRGGPWCHGEVRHGGLPDWIVARGNTRTEDAAFLARTTELYGQIAAQLQGLLWKDGGPVIGIQLDNEYRGPASYLLRLKQIARAAGLDTPLYTRTSWPDLQTPMPYGEILPLHSVYPEGFWDRELTAMPGRYWAGFHFSTLRTYANIADQALGKRDVKDAPDVGRYPYLTCEIGGGMMSSYHRRILVDPRDIEVTTLVKLGSGSMSPGYYMYHGGVNPEGRTTLMEEQATLHTNLNDLPVKNYDFHAPLGQYGQVRPHYHLLRRLHLFMHAFGSDMTGMDTVLPDLRPAGQDDTTTLRWAARSDGRSGFLFVNNYERGRSLPPKAGVQFALNPSRNDAVGAGPRMEPARSRGCRAGSPIPPVCASEAGSGDPALQLPTASLRLSEAGPLTFPHEPVTIPADASFIWPFNLDLGNGVTLAWSTAQPLTRIINGDKNCTVFFAATPGVPAEFAFRGARVIARHGRTETGNDGLTRVLDLQPGRDVAITANSRVRIVLLSEPDALALWQGTWHGCERAFLTPAGLVIDGDTLRLSSRDPAPLSVSVFPVLIREDDGIFQRLSSAPMQAAARTVRLTPIQAAGPLRVIALGAAPSSVAVAPVDADFAHAALWRVELPAGLDPASDPILRLNYTGDVARVMIGGKFVMDDFYNGLPLEIGLRRHAADLRQGGLTVAILPLQKAAPIYLSSPAARPDFGARDGIAELHGAELIPAHTAEFSGRREPD